MSALTISRLNSGGLITNYYCSSSCRHCLYGCSPKWDKIYIDEYKAQDILRKIISMGCYLVHIGGGEPFMDAFSLEKVIKMANKVGVDIEYIETNSSWYKDENSCRAVISSLKQLGIHTLLVSISPFHNEYIPLGKVKSVMGACKKEDLSVFPWVQEFFREIDSFDDSKPHSLEEYAGKYGKEYVAGLPSRYWINLKGRAMLTYKDVYAKKPLGEILRNSRGCTELENTSHFHIDLFGNYIPGLCSGLAIYYEDLGNSLNPEKYPFITTLYMQGIKGLLKIAQELHGFIPESEYLSKCHLCFEIRKFLALEKKISSQELKPLEFYNYV